MTVVIYLMEILLCVVRVDSLGGGHRYIAIKTAEKFIEVLYTSNIILNEDEDWHSRTTMTYPLVFYFHMC